MRGAPGTRALAPYRALSVPQATPVFLYLEVVYGLHSQNVAGAQGGGGNGEEGDECSNVSCRNFDFYGDAAWCR